MLDFDIQRFTRHCHATGRELSPGEAFYSVLVSEGERLPFFFVVLEGEVRLSRSYDRQTILMGTITAGNYLGETTLLLDTQWLATAPRG